MGSHARQVEDHAANGTARDPYFVGHTALGKYGERYRGARRRRDHDPEETEFHHGDGIGVQRECGELPWWTYGDVVPRAGGRAHAAGEQDRHLRGSRRWLDD